MNMSVLTGLMIPFAGTALGAACVFLLKKELGTKVQKALTGFASGVMVAASIWSLIIPAMEQSEGLGKLRFLPSFSSPCFLLSFRMLLCHSNVPILSVFIAPMNRC